MSFIKEKMVELILNESEYIDEKHEGYRKVVLGWIVEILNAEREHKAQKTNIQKQVDAVCYAAGDYLVKKRDVDNTTTEATQ